MSAVQTQQTAKGKYRPEIDGLRAFAVVAVIINHFNKDILPGGYLGVDIFFVISGYVITSSLHGRSSKDFKDFISGFYERRIKRLVPALSVFVLITSIAICLFNPTPGTSLRTGLTSLFGLSNLYLLRNSTDYFAQSTELNIFTHTWSLGVEEQFYILFPFLIWFSGFGRQTKNGARNLFLAVGALTIASLVAFLYLYPTNQPAAYFLMPSRFWEMAAGCLIFIGFQKRASVEQLLEKVPPLLVMALIVGVMYLPMSLAAASTIAVVALSSILIASLKKQTAAFKIFTNPKVVYIGLISYSLYLWHWGVLSISRWTIGIHWWSIPFQVALMFGLAVASYRWIETPFRRLKIQQRKTVFGFLICSTILTTSGIILLLQCSKIFYLGNTLRPLGKEIVQNNKLLWGGYDKCIVDKDADITKIYKYEYDCSYGDGHDLQNSKRTRILVIGNSIAASFAEAFADAPKNLVFTLIPAYGGVPINGVATQDENRKEIVKYYWSTIVPNQVKKLKTGDVVLYINEITGFIYSTRTDAPDFDPTTSIYNTNVGLVTQGLTNFADSLKQKGIFFIITRPLPNPPECHHFQKQWFNVLNTRDECDFPESEFIDKTNLPVNKLISRLVNDFENVSDLDLADVFCDESKCDYYSGDTLLYRDGLHPSSEAAVLSSHTIFETISSLINRK